MTKPPSTTRVAPLTGPTEAGERSQTIASAISSGEAARPSAVSELTEPFSAELANTGLGHCLFRSAPRQQLTATPRDPSDRAADSPSASTAPLLAGTRPCRTSPPRIPATLDTVTLRPPRGMRGPLTHAAERADNIYDVHFAKPRGVEGGTRSASTRPAQVARPWMGPHRPPISSKHRVTLCSSVTSTETANSSSSPRSLSLWGSRPRAVELGHTRTPEAKIGALRRRFPLRRRRQPRARPSNDTCVAFTGTSFPSIRMTAPYCRAPSKKGSGSANLLTPAARIAIASWCTRGSPAATMRPPSEAGPPSQAVTRPPAASMIGTSATMS